MSIEVRVPALPESVSEATLVAWHKNAGDAIRRDENLADLETDKVVLELPAPRDGVLSQQLIDAGANVTEGTLLALIDSVADAAQQPARAAADKADSDAAASPSVRRLLHEHDLDENDVEGSGKHGRILKADVERTVADHTTTPPAIDDHPGGEERLSERVPMSRLRKTIADRLVAVQHETAMLTTFNEVDMQAVKQLRKQHRDAFEARHGIRLGMMSFFVKAATEALKAYPAINASIDGDDVVYHNYFDIGIAVASPRGLVVPVLRDCDRLGFAGIESHIAEFGAAAKAGKLALEQLQGGTFTITNGGVFGSLMSTPILNPPQSAILGMHTIQDRPVVRDGEIVIRPMMYLALSYDHRIVDGADAVQFLAHIKRAIEQPERILLEL